MAYLSYIVMVAATVASAWGSAAEPAEIAETADPVRAKKDVLLASPYAAALPYAYDDGSYYPGKYERTAIAIQPAVSAYSALQPAYSALQPTYSALQSTYSGVHPAAYSALQPAYSALQPAVSAYTAAVPAGALPAYSAYQPYAYRYY